VQVIQDLVYDALVFNARDDFDRASTAATDLDVDIEDALTCQFQRVFLNAGQKGGSAEFAAGGFQKSV
jgi:hypothetical protein